MRWYWDGVLSVQRRIWDRLSRRVEIGPDVYAVGVFMQANFRLETRAFLRRGAHREHAAGRQQDGGGRFLAHASGSEFLHNHNRGTDAPLLPGQCKALRGEVPMEKQLGQARWFAALRRSILGLLHQEPRQCDRGVSDSSWPDPETRNGCHGARWTRSMQRWYTRSKKQSSMCCSPTRT